MLRSSLSLLLLVFAFSPLAAVGQGLQLKPGEIRADAEKRTFLLRVPADHSDRHFFPWIELRYSDGSKSYTTFG